MSRKEGSVELVERKREKEGGREEGEWEGGRKGGMEGGREEGRKGGKEGGKVTVVLPGQHSDDVRVHMFNTGGLVRPGQGCALSGLSIGIQTDLYRSSETNC